MKERVITSQKIAVLLISLVAMAILLFVAGNANPIIVVQDPGLEEALREKIDRPEGPIYQTDLSTVTELDASDRNIVSLEGIGSFSRLAKLNLSGNSIMDVTPLRDLAMLKRLNWSDNGLRDIESIQALTGLTHLSLFDNGIRDLSPLSGLTALEELNLGDNLLTDLGGLETLSALKELDLSENRVADLTPLGGMTRLEDLRLDDNAILSLEGIHFSAIHQLPLKTLSLRHNVVEGDPDRRLSDITLLQGMTSLVELDVRDNHVEDLVPLGTLLGLKDLDLRQNRFTRLDALEGLTDLERLNLRENRITSLAPISGLTNLKYLNIHSNPAIHSLKPLENLTGLESLILMNVPAAEEAGVLRSLTRLQDLNALGTGLDEGQSDVFSYLRSQGALQGEVRPASLIHTVLPPVFSRNGGFHDAEFRLELNSPEPGGQIYYTLDGSEPTRDSLVYSPRVKIRIEGRAQHPAKVIRARIITEQNLISETVTRTYFVDPDIRDRFTLPLLSLVTDEDNLYNPETGIFAGNNAFERGRDWERPIHIEFFETDGSTAFRQNAGVRVHGGWTRRYDQKSLRLYAGTEYDEEDAFRHEIFEGLTRKNSGEPVARFQRLLLRNSGNDWNSTLFRDALMQSLVEPLGTLDTQSYRPSLVFINGEYWGIYNMRELLDEYYIEEAYGIDAVSVDILENNQPLEDPDTPGAEHYNRMLNYIETGGLGDDSHYEFVQTLMDTENFRDYNIAHTYFGNTDWPHNNVRYWRARTTEYLENASYGLDGRWRWMMFDTDPGFARYNSPVTARHAAPRDVTHNTIQWVLTEFDGYRGTRTWPNFLFRSLVENETFRTDFLNRYADLLNSYFLPDPVILKIDQMETDLEPEMDDHIRRWGAIHSMARWHTNVEVLRDFARRRPDYIRRYLVEAFELSGTLSLTLETSDAKGGFVRISSLNLDEPLPGLQDPASWTGIYFKGVPVPLQAISRPGFVFSHWEGIEGEDKASSTVTLTPHTDTRIRAVFKPAS